MPATFNITLGNGTATYTLSGTFDKQKVLDTAEDAARYVYPVRYQLYEDAEKTIPIPYDNLTLTQQKAIIAKEFVHYMLECATAYHAISATDAARAAAIAEAEDKYGLE